MTGIELNALDYGFGILVELDSLGWGDRIHLFGIRVRIVANFEGANDAVIRSWSFLVGYTLADNKNLIGKGLDVITIFHNR